VRALRSEKELGLGDAVRAARLKGQEVEVFLIDPNLKTKLNGQAKEWSTFEQARNDPLWPEVREAIQVELKRVFEDFKTVQHVPKSQVEEDVRRFGAVKVHLKDALIPVKVKYNTEGELTKIKARFVVTDRVVDGKMPDVYAPAISGDTVRYTCNLQLQIRGVAAVKDVQGAYHHGKPRDPSHPIGR
jgi:hypothetical protein